MNLKNAGDQLGGAQGPGVDEVGQKQRGEPADQHLRGEDQAAENDGEGAEAGLDQANAKAEPHHRLVDDQSEEDLSSFSNYFRLF